MADVLARAGHWLASIFLTLSAVCLVAIMCLTVVEVIGRYAFNAPIFGRQDLAQILLALAIFFAFPVVTLRGEQIDVDLLDSVFSVRAAFWRDRLIALMMSGSLLTMGYWLFARAEKFQSRGITTELLFLPKYPLIYAIATVVTATGLLLAVATATKMFKGVQT
ncbi:TRAP transporter small permease [Tateyamaria omphalii]|uniref:TRAP transporter small permease n=1 Tax=Tateyamaria omphalii TaxID=299262 RepID=UPI001C996A09|nr:TRAP transporter small permease [Tateyamaria omphalii]MBY5935197.1 TRAP transporter small permease [Tateyamaria omphalii]